MNSTQYLKNLKKKIEQLDTYHHQKILSIIKKHSVDFSENKNGTEGSCSVEGNGDQQALLLFIITSENGFDQFQMSARGDRQKLCKALDDSKNQRFKRTHLLFFWGINMA